MMMMNKKKTKKEKEKKMRCRRMKGRRGIKVKEKNGKKRRSRLEEEEGRAGEHGRSLISKFHVVFVDALNLTCTPFYQTIDLINTILMKSEYGQNVVQPSD